MLVEVALPVPVPRTFTYRVSRPVAEGTRVRVPFSGRQLVGWVVGPAAGRDLESVRDVRDILDETEPGLPPDVLRLCHWIADYYLTPLGIVLRTALPVLLTRPGRSAPPGQTRRLLRLRRTLPSLLERNELFARARRQRECFEFLESVGGQSEVAHLTRRLGFSHAVLRGLVSKGVASFVEERLQRDPFATQTPPPPQRHRLTAPQQEAVAALRDAAGASGADPPARATSMSHGKTAGTPPPFLLFGVTGSGKTLVYIELLKTIVQDQGRGAIVLVPEISLTPQTVARFRAEFGDLVAVLHSGLSDGERFDAWRALRAGERRVAIGARSAIFAPVRQLGAIVVDEEHESSYKQSEAPRYHAREVAVMRARLAGAVCVLGSATPALETWHNVRRRKYRLLELPARVAGRPLPPVRILDLRGPERPHKVRRATLADPLLQAIQRRLDRQEQTILLLNRRGYANFVQCRDCGAVWQCPQCNVSLTYHRSLRRLVCHYCYHEEAPPVSCDACGSGDLSFRGIGTEQVERELLETFPTARVARMDVDTTSGRWSHHDILARVEHRQVDILLGTQMIAKGLDFPGVTLVGVVNADVAMNLPDFRAAERTFQLLTQVAGRAGRGPGGGEVLVQTALPQHYVIACAATHDYRSFAERELKERKAPPYPPVVRLVNVVISGTAQETVAEAAGGAAEWIEARLSATAAAIRLTGPAPCPIDRIRGRWRWHFLLRSEAARPLGALCRSFQEKYRPQGRGADLRIILDRDPVSLL